MPHASVCLCTKQNNMPRIISPELNSKLRREYRLRFFSVLFFLLAGTVLVSIALISSSYLLLSLYEKAYVHETLNTKGEAATQISDTFNAKVGQVHGLIQKIPPQSSVEDFQIVNTLFEYANSGININAVEILPEAPATLITLRGEALTRDALLQFQDKIEEDARFEGFSIPIESLTKQRDISFAVNFIYHEN